MPLGAPNLLPNEFVHGLSARVVSGVEVAIAGGPRLSVGDDAPDGVGTRNVPQDSPSPPARVEQGTIASKPGREQQARHRTQPCADPKNQCRNSRSIPHPSTPQTLQI